MLDVTDFTRNAAAPQFGRYGMCNVRYSKAVKGSPPRRRNVLTTMGWAVDVLTEYDEDIRGLYAPGKRTALWPTERGGRISVASINIRFAEYRSAAGPPPELHPHCLRHSYVTHLIEDGFDPFFACIILSPTIAQPPDLRFCVENSVLVALVCRCENRFGDG